MSSRRDPAVVLKTALPQDMWARMARNLVSALLRDGDAKAAVAMAANLDQLEEASQRVLAEREVVGGC